MPALSTYPARTVARFAAATMISRACLMLEHSFIHLPGIDSTTEEELWSRGVTSWNLLEEDAAADETELLEALGIADYWRARGCSWTGASAVCDSA